MIENQENKETDLGYIKLPIEKFFEIFEKKKNEEINENLGKKTSDLINNYNCFVSNYDAKSLWEKKKLMAQKKNSSNKIYNRNKPRVLLIDFSDEMKCKKEFISYLNKLTDINKEVIYNKISLFIKELNPAILATLFEVLLNFIKISSNNIYIDVLFLFDMDYINLNINNYLKSFIENREWLPKEIITDYKVLFNNNNYDMYCSYVKLKKHSLSIIKALMIILRRLNDDNNYSSLLLKEIYQDIINYLNNQNYKHILELLLDELLIIFEYLDNEEIIANLKTLDLNNFEYSTKFKIMKILDNNR